MSGKRPKDRLYGRYNSPEDPARCVAEVRNSDYRFPEWHQCKHKRGHGPEGLWCKRHDPDALAAKEEAARKEREGIQAASSATEREGHNILRLLGIKGHVDHDRHTFVYVRELIIPFDEARKLIRPQ